MTAQELTFIVALAVAAVGAVVIIYIAALGAPGLVGWQPPQGSSRAPVYTFFIAWFITGFAGRSADTDAGWLWVRLALLVIVVIAMFVSWWRLRRNPNPPPRI